MDYINLLYYKIAGFIQLFNDKWVQFMPCVVSFIQEQIIVGTLIFGG